MVLIGEYNTSCVPRVAMHDDRTKREAKKKVYLLLKDKHSPHVSWLFQSLLGNALPIISASESGKHHDSMAGSHEVGY